MDQAARPGTSLARAIEIRRIRDDAIFGKAAGPVQSSSLMRRSDVREKVIEMRQPPRGGRARREIVEFARARRRRLRRMRSRRARNRSPRRLHRTCCSSRDRKPLKSAERESASSRPASSSVQKQLLRPLAHREQEPRRREPLRCGDVAVEGRRERRRAPSANARTVVSAL